MSAAAITAARVLELKAEAKQNKQAHGGKLSAALEQIAKREGYGNWAALVVSAGGREAVQEAKFDMPTEAMVQRAERHASRLQRYGSDSKPWIGVDMGRELSQPVVMTDEMRADAAALADATSLEGEES